jgi:predicted hydrocarbon binding protein
MDNAAGFPPKIVHGFVETLSSTLGPDTLSAVIEKAGLPMDWTDTTRFTELDDFQSSQAYGRLQTALRKYYGRGARSILLSIGCKLWNRLLKEAAFGIKAQAAIVRGLPIGLRRKRALDLLARQLSVKPGDITIHTLDLDLLFVDHISPAATGQSDSTPICYVTLGMIRECLYWALGYEHDIEEISCRALGARECEFKITAGG